MNTTDAGRIGEAKASLELIKHGWYPFVDQSGKCPVDLLAWKNGKLISLQVKTTNTMSKSGNWTVQIGSIRPNRTGNTIKKFDPYSCDYLAVYVVPTDTLYFLKANEITTTRCLTITNSLVSLIPE